MNGTACQVSVRNNHYKGKNYLYTLTQLWTPYVTQDIQTQCQLFFCGWPPAFKLLVVGMEEIKHIIFINTEPGFGIPLRHSANKRALMLSRKWVSVRECHVWSECVYRSQSQSRSWQFRDGRWQKTEKTYTQQCHRQDPQVKILEDNLTLV
jgi:hypothetical protein